MRVSTWAFPTGIMTQRKYFCFSSIRRLTRQSVRLPNDSVAFKARLCATDAPTGRLKKMAGR